MLANVAQRLLVLGAGGHARVVLDILFQQADRHVVGLLDNNPALHGRRIDGVPVLGPIDALTELAEQHDARAVIVAIGDNGVRRGLARQVLRAGLSLTNAVHPSATLAESVTVGRNVVVAAGAVICAHSQVGDSVILNTGCLIDHFTMVGEGAHVCPGARVAGRVKIEPGAFVGIGATVVPKVTIGCEAIVGAGAVVLADVAPLATVVGVPARAIKQPTANADELAMLLPARPHVTAQPELAQA